MTSSDHIATQPDDTQPEPGIIPVVDRDKDKGMLHDKCTEAIYDQDIPYSAIEDNSYFSEEQYVVLGDNRYICISSDNAVEYILKSTSASGTSANQIATSADNASNVARSSVKGQSSCLTTVKSEREMICHKNKETPRPVGRPIKGQPCVQPRPNSLMLNIRSYTDYLAYLKKMKKRAVKEHAARESRQLSMRVHRSHCVHPQQSKLSLSNRRTPSHNKNNLPNSLTPSSNRNNLPNWLTPSNNRNNFPTGNWQTHILSILAAPRSYSITGLS